MRKAIEIAIQIARGLAAAHDTGLIHRDLKPDNIFLLSDGQVKILDFGLARQAERSGSGATETAAALTCAGTVMGTVGYMSPEQVRGQAVDARSDLFALGIVLYEMLTGRRAFQGATAADTMAAILNTDPPELSRSSNEIPPSLDRIVRHCLEKNPLERFQTARDIEFALGTAPAATPASGKRNWIRVVLVAAAVVVAGAAVTMVVKSMRSSGASVTPEFARTAVAVLPFRNLSTGDANAYFAGGLHEEVLTQLAKVASLTVMGRTSVMSYAGTTKPPREIARELSVGSIVDGTVQVVDGRLKVSVHLLNAETGREVWGDTYNKTLDDAFAIQSDIAQQVVAAVGAVIAASERASLTTAPTLNAEAYRLYLQGQEYRRRGVSRRNLEAMQQLDERAIALDPGFALAHVALAYAHGALFWHYHLPEQAGRQLVEAETALRLAPDLAEAHWAMGLAHYWGRRDYQQALAEFAIALRGLPNDADLMVDIGAVHRRAGHWVEMDAAFQRASKLDPRNTDVFNQLGNTYYMTHRYADAVSAYDRALTLDPSLAGAALSKALTYFLWRGDLGPLGIMLDGVPGDAALSSYGSANSYRASLLLWQRQPDALLALLTREPNSVFKGYFSYLPTSLYAGWAHQLRGDTSAAQAAFRLALAAIDAVPPDLVDERVHAARGLALAGLGRKSEALAEVHWLEQSPVYREDALLGSRFAEDRAMILANAGEPAAALDEIERLLSGPSLLSAHTLRLDPRWDPIREQPRFKALLVTFAIPGTR